MNSRKILTLGGRQGEEFRNWVAQQFVTYEYYPAETQQSDVKADHPLFLATVAGITVDDTVSGGIHVFYQTNYKEIDDFDRSVEFMKSFLLGIEIQDPAGQVALKEIRTGDQMIEAQGVKVIDLETKRMLETTIDELKAMQQEVTIQDAKND